MDDKLLAIGLRLAKPLPTTAEGRDRQAAEFRDQLVDACRKPPRSSKYLSCIGLYILYDEESGEPRSTMIRPIVRIITETSPEFRPGSTNGSSSMIQSIPRGVLLKAQYVEAARMGKFAQVPIDSLFLNQRGKHRDGTSGWYYLAAFIGRDQNRREKLGIPDSLFSRSTYGG